MAQPEVALEMSLSELNEAIEKIKQSLTSAPTLSFFDPSKAYSYLH
jgi:hypothetical protein